jgi:regulator of protease activity HflC (stomatin/prohibitin superfamily)
MTNPMIKIHNIETDEVVDREMTAGELKEYEASCAQAEAEKAELEAKMQAKADLLVRLGITEDEAKLLLG